MGRLYFFEGPDGSGKTIMTKHLFDRIREEREYFPYIEALPNKKTFAYDKIKEILSMEDPGIIPDAIQSLFLFNMIDTFERIINSILTYPNSIVLVDRSLISTFIYNSMNGGTLYDTCTRYITEKTGLRENEADFDIFNKTLTHSIINPSNVFFIMPPVEVLLKHSKDRMQSNEADVNDKVDKVKSTYNAYKDAYSFFSNKARNVNEFIMLDNWDMNKSEEENYSKMSDIILDMILLDYQS